MKKEDLLTKYSEPIPVGSKGFVRLIDIMGDDSSIVQAARISYGAGTKTVREDRGLIRYLIRNAHSTPLEMAEIKFHIKLPIDVMRQLIRHRTSSTNEVSTRYSEVKDDFNATSSTEWRFQSQNNKQGSSGFVPEDLGLVLSKREDVVLHTGYQAYQDALGAGVAREQARKMLPLCTYTEIYWKLNLRNLLHFLTLRLHSHAQLEIREFASAIASIVQDWVPLTWEAFEDYQLGGQTFSKQEVALLKALLAGKLGIETLCLEDHELISDRWEMVAIHNPDITFDSDLCTYAKPKTLQDLDKETRKALFDEFNLGSLRERADFLRKLT